MPSGYTAGFRDQVLLDVGVCWYKQQSTGIAAKFGVSQGGLTFRREVDMRDIEFDGGGRAPIEGLSRKTRHVGVIAGTFLIEFPKHLGQIEPGFTSAVAAGVTTYTPKDASMLFAPDTDYIQRFRMVGVKPDGTYVDILFERALIRSFSWAMADNNEHKLAECEIMSVLQDDLAAISTDTPPYVYREYATLSAGT